MKTNRIWVAAWVALLVWGGHRAAAQDEAPFSIKETKKQDGANWKLKTEICNRTTAGATVAWGTWPRTKDGKKIRGEPQWHPAGFGTAGGGPWAFDARFAGGVDVPAGGCKDNETTFDQEPFSIYVRVFVKQANGTWVNAPNGIVSHNVHLSASACLFDSNPPRDHLTLEVAIPYPAPLHERVGGPQPFLITDVRLPEGWGLAFAKPGIGQDFLLHPGQREFDALLVATASTPVPMPFASVARVTWRARDHDYERTAEHVILADNDRPQLRATGARRGRQLVLTLEVSDPGGLHHQPVAQVTTAEGTLSLLMTLREVVAEDPQAGIGMTHGVYEVALPLSLRGPAHVRFGARDQCGNVGELEMMVGLGGEVQPISRP